MKKTNETETEEVSNSENKGERPAPGKVEKERRGREGKTFQGKGNEVRK